MSITIYPLHAQLSRDYISFYENDNKYADVIIRVRKDENVIKEFHVHSFVLLARSYYFRKKIEEIKEKHDGKFVIEMPYINPQLFDQIIRYFYGGQLKCEPSEIFDYILISKELNIAELLEFLQDLLLKSPNQIYQKFSTTLQISSSYENLHNFCLNTIQENPEIIFKSQDFHLLNEDTLLFLLQNKKLNLKEIEKWKSIIKWGNYHTFTGTGKFNVIPDVSFWTKVEFRDLANTLVRLIPLIDFNKIAPEDFYKEVKPFKKIVGKQRYEEILQYHLFFKNEQSNHANQEQRSTFAWPFLSSQQNNESELPKLKPPPEPLISANVDSKLISIDYFRLIARWINNETSNRYKLSLLLRGSKHGFTASKFHELCDNKGATLSIIKVKGSGEIIGGYNPESWDGSLFPHCQYYNVEGSFVFKLDKRNIDNSFIGRHKHTINFTIGNHPNNGPIFVGALYIKGGSDGDFQNFQSVCKGNTYNVSIRADKNKFSVDEYEVYRVIEHRIY